MARPERANANKAAAQLLTPPGEGVPQVGAVLVNVNPAYRLSELQYVLDQSGATTIVLAPGLREADFVSMLEQASGEGPVLRRRIVLGDSPPGGPSWLGWTDVLNAGDHPGAASALRVCRHVILLLPSPSATICPSPCILPRKFGIWRHKFIFLHFGVWNRVKDAVFGQYNPPDRRSEGAW